MIDEATRTAILKLHEQDHGSRTIAKALGVARSTVQRVIDSKRRLRQCGG
jgi:IS30 family transposase